ncbi:DUF3307 domain-containing protein [Roseobacter sp.]|uniref:DUF3307 domain-containing protein n=1 Tax=Roseobacter sp. TaxID=1907202 RepID=UPI0032970E77
MSDGAILILLCFLQFKHMLADYFFQTRFMLEGRGARYLHAGTFVHAGVHAAGSFAAFSLIGVPPRLTVPLVLAEWAVHFHIDWLKGRYTIARSLTPVDAGFWRLSGFDQALHHLTYLGMIWVWVHR